MRKNFCFLVVLLLVITVLSFAACSGSKNGAEPPTQTVLENDPVETSTSAEFLPIIGNCRLALFLPGQVTDYSTLQAGVKEAADQNGCQLDIYAAEYSQEKMVAQISEVDQNKTWGMIIAPIDHVDVERVIQQTSKRGVPVILIGADGLPSIQTNRVIPDFADGARKAAGFICGAIHEYGNIIQLVDSQIDGANGQVSKAFSDGIQSTCPGANLITIPIQGSEEDVAKTAMMHALSAEPDVSAVFAYTESAMDGAIDASQTLGILGIVTAEFGQEHASVDEDQTRMVDAILRPTGSEIGKASIQAILAQAQGDSAGIKIEVAMQISVADISFQLPPDPTAKRITIGVILPDGADTFYQQVYRGLLPPSRSMDNVTLKVRSANSDSQKMIQDLDWMVNAKVDAILLSPIEDPDLFIAIDKIARSGMPIVTLGLPLEMDNIISQISFDEYAVGYNAGKYLCTALGGKGTIADVYNSSSPQKEIVRSRGLQDYQQDNCPDVQIISRTLPVEIEPACQELQKFLAETDAVTGIFAHSDELGLCVVDFSKTKFVVGIGASAAALQSIGDGRLSATLGQYPYEMGVIAMETTIEYLYGRAVEPTKPFPINLITKESLK